MDLTGQTFHNLRVLRKHPEKGHNSKWVCLCLVCGNETIKPRPNLVSGLLKDCGCQKSAKVSAAVTKHGDSHAKGTRGYEIYKKWVQMHHRCRDPKKPYIRKGITVCPEWEEYENFKLWADTDSFSPELELDRIDNSQGYFPSNCRWVTHAQNCQNKDHPQAKAVRNSKGEVFSCGQDAAKMYGLHRNAVTRALKTGYLCAGMRWYPVEET